MSAHVLVAEDDPKQAEMIRRYLEVEGHVATVVHDGRSALETARRLRPDLLVLDLMMPVMNGLEVCRDLREVSDEPAVLMLTARTSEEDLLLSLDLGADDYLTKPFSPRELMARIRTLLRRTRRAPAGDEVLRVGPLSIDKAQHVVRCAGRQLECTPGEFTLLATLAAHPSRVFTRSQLLTGTHGSDRYVNERTVDVHVMNLRRKIEPDPRHPVHLVTVFGVGYKLTGGPDDAR